MRERKVRLAPSLTLALAPRLRFTMGPLVQYSHMPADAGTLLASTGPYYGTGNFGQIGASMLLEFDTRDLSVAATSGVQLGLAGDWVPAVWDAIAPFGRISAEASTYLSVSDAPTTTVAVGPAL